jgi:hypothetical protein
MHTGSPFWDNDFSKKDLKKDLSSDIANSDNNNNNNNNNKRNNIVSIDGIFA